MVKYIFFTLAFLTAFLSHNLWAAAEAKFDREKINLNESVQLIISIDSSNFFGEPDVAILSKNFDILSRNKSSNHSIINGQSTSKTSWNYQLSAKQAGIINLPAISVGSEKTQASSLVVAPPQTGSTASSAVSAAFIETELSKKTAFVQEQFILTIRVNDSVGLQEISMQEIKLDNAFIKEISNSNYEREIGGKKFRTYEIHYAIFAQNSGDLIIPATVINGTIIENTRRGSFFRNTGRPVQIKGEQQVVTIQPPTQNDSGIWLPAKKIQLHESWSQDLNKLRSGDSITRSIVITATGLSGEQLPALEAQALSGVKFYPDQAEVSETINANNIIGQRIEKQTLVLTQSGHIQLPAIHIDWFNTDTAMTETASLPAVDIHVSANPELEKAIPPSQETQGEAHNLTAAIKQESVIPTENSQQLRLWQALSLAGFISSALLLTLLIRSKRQLRPKKTGEKISVASSHAAQLRLQQACKGSNALEIHRACLVFAKAVWPAQTIHSLADIKRHAASAELEKLLETLDQAFAKGESFQQGKVLFDTFKELSQTETKPSSLKDLYPT